MKFAELTDSNGNLSSRIFHCSRLWEESAPTIEKQSMGSCMFSIQDVVSMICLDATAYIRPLGAGSSGGQEKVFGTKFLKLLKSMLTQLENLALDVVAVDSTLIDSKKAASQRDTTDTNGAKVQRFMLQSARIQYLSA
jgi:hypothetical protein